MKKVIIALATAASLLVAGGAVAAPANAAVTASSKKYTNSQKNGYWNAVKRLDSDALIIGKKSTVEMGISICDLLRAGGTVRDLASLAADADPIVQDLVIASMAAAPVYLCRDQRYKFN
jgi:hypothetical protein